LNSECQLFFLILYLFYNMIEIYINY
jgi:hypothetical protein